MTARKKKEANRCNGQIGSHEAPRRCRRRAVITVRWSQAAMRVCWGADWNTAVVCATCRDRIDQIAAAEGYST